MRKALAIVSATLQRDHELANDLTHELTPSEARFAVAVTAEYLSQAIHQLALTVDDTAERIWQGCCLANEQAIQRAESQIPPS